MIPEVKLCECGCGKPSPIARETRLQRNLVGAFPIYLPRRKVEFGGLRGQILTKIEGAIGAGVMDFYAADGKHYRLWHEQDCCELVVIEDICGDLDDLVGSPILLAEEIIHKNEQPEGVPAPKGQDEDDSYTWTFYKLSTIKGSVTIRWYGESNGYYSESVDFTEC